MKLRTNSPLQAFTLLEIMLVVTIISLLLASGFYFTKGQVGFAQDTRANGDIQSMSTQLKLYEGMNGFLPSTEQGLRALVERPDSSPKPRQWRQLMSKLPTDPWGNEYVYEAPGKHNPDGFDLYSVGKDHVASTADDIGNWDK